MLITDRKELLLLLAVLQDEIDFFLKSANADPTEADERTCSEFFRAISCFLEKAAEKEFRQFKDAAWMILINQLHISNLVSDLQADVQLFTTTLKLTPEKIDNLARAEFLGCIFDFLERSIKFIGEPQDDYSPPPTTHPTLASYLPCQYPNLSANHSDAVCNCASCKASSPNAFAGCSDPSLESDHLLRWWKRKPKLPIRSKPSAHSLAHVSY